MCLFWDYVHYCIFDHSSSLTLFSILDTTQRRLFRCDRTWPYRSKVWTFSIKKRFLFFGLIHPKSRPMIHTCPLSICYSYIPGFHCSYLCTWEMTATLCIIWWMWDCNPVVSGIERGTAKPLPGALSTWVTMHIALCTLILVGWL